MFAEQRVAALATATVTQQSLQKTTTLAAPADPRRTLTEYVRTKTLNDSIIPAVAALVGDIGSQVKVYGALSKVPAAEVKNVRNDMYLTSEGIAALLKNKAVTLDGDTKRNLTEFKKEIDAATKFIPLWAKFAVAIALGLGTMVANRSGLQWSTVRNPLMAWVLTLPVAIVLSGSLYWLFSKLF